MEHGAWVGAWILTWRWQTQYDTDRTLGGRQLQAVPAEAASLPPRPHPSLPASPISPGATPLPHTRTPAPLLPV